MYNASKVVGCVEIRRFRKIGYFVYFDETGDSPDTLICPKTMNR